MRFLKAGLIVAAVLAAAHLVRRRMIPYTPQFRHARNTGGEPLPTRKSSEPIVGYRLWRVRNTNGRFALHSLMQTYEWEIENTAACHPSINTEPHDEDSPGLECACGFYCQLPTQPIEEWESHIRGRIHASGTVALSGRVIRCDLGYKAQHALMQSPVIIDTVCEVAKCEATPTKVKVSNYSRDFWTTCDEHAVPKKDDDVFSDLKPFLSDLLDQLHARYPGIEFYTFAAI